MKIIVASFFTFYLAISSLLAQINPAGSSALFVYGQTKDPKCTSDFEVYLKTGQVVKNKYHLTYSKPKSRLHYPKLETIFPSMADSITAHFKSDTSTVSITGHLHNEAWLFPAVNGKLQGLTVLPFFYTDSYSAITIYKIKRTPTDREVKFLKYNNEVQPFSKKALSEIVKDNEISLKLVKGKDNTQMLSALGVVSGLTLGGVFLALADESRSPAMYALAVPAYGLVGFSIYKIVSVRRNYLKAIRVFNGEDIRNIKK